MKDRAFMNIAKLIERKSTGHVRSSTKNRDLSSREKIEETLVNLATVLGHKEVLYSFMQDLTHMYSVDGEKYQRGANLILDLSRELLAQHIRQGGV